MGKRKRIGKVWLCYGCAAVLHTQEEADKHRKRCGFHGKRMRRIPENKIPDWIVKAVQLKDGLTHKPLGLAPRDNDKK